MIYNKFLDRPRMEEMRANSMISAKYRAWMPEIPTLEFPPGWKIKIIPPFGGAAVRFEVNDGISVYLDMDSSLGIMPYPYWEVNQYYDDVARCPIDDTNTLLDLIAEIIELRDFKKEYEINLETSDRNDFLEYLEWKDQKNLATGLTSANRLIRKAASLIP